MLFALMRTPAGYPTDAALILMRSAVFPFLMLCLKRIWHQHRMSIAPVPACGGNAFAPWGSPQSSQLR